MNLNVYQQHCACDIFCSGDHTDTDIVGGEISFDKGTLMIT